MKIFTITLILTLFTVINTCYSEDYWEKIPYNHGYLSSLICGKGETVFAGLDGPTKFFIFSTNNGLTWNEMKFDTAVYHILSLSVNKDNGYLFAGTEDDGILRSTDDGAGWSRICTDSIIGCVPSVLADNKGNVYAVQCFTHVWHSPDNGETWEKLIGLYSESLGYNSFHINNKGYFFANFGKYNFISRNGGYDWEQLNNPDSSIFRFYLDKNDNLYYFNNEIYKSTDDGATWNKVDYPDSIGKITNVFIDDREKMFVTTNIEGRFKVYLKKNPDANWMDITAGIGEGSNYSREILLTNDKHYLIGADSTGFYRSTFSEDDDIINSVEQPAREEIRLVGDYLIFPDEWDCNSEATVYSTLGSELLRAAIGQGVYVGSLSPGVYFVKVKDSYIKFARF